MARNSHKKPQLVLLVLLLIITGVLMLFGIPDFIFGMLQPWGSSNPLAYVWWVLGGLLLPLFMIGFGVWLLTKVKDI